ncbi:DNA/RNA helicase domain-containing protein [Streptomyces sp. NPDC048254]|uniref:DNA/RNA helicase domain-containing protein n=1 Tax=Streptomyces sp. NPDC048254 TaxID=3365525 RepID=UPI00371FE7C4
MLLLRLSAQDLLTLNSRRRMVPHLAARYRYFRGRDVSDGEREAWAASLVELAEDLVEADRGNVEMVVECAATVDEPEKGEPPLIDVVLVGRHPETHLPSFQLVELKRWSLVTRVEAATAELVRVPGYKKPKKHPALQLRNTYQLFTGDQGPLRGITVECGGFAYLHNATDDSVRPLLDTLAPTGAYERVYTLDSRDLLLADLRRHFAEDGAASEAEQLLRLMNLRNTPLLDAMIRSRGEDTVFTLRGQQKRVAESVLQRAARVLGSPDEPVPPQDDERAVFIVTGGAGTGKSAVGLQLRADFEAAGHAVMYASGSRAFNGALQEQVGYTDKEFRKRFAFFSHFVRPPDPPLDVLISDEAHRLRERTIDQYRRKEKMGTQPQVDDLLDAARLTVFFLDESQSVRPKEVGTVSLIEGAARARGITPLRYGLREEWRCGGSDAYIRWVRAVLDIEAGTTEWTPDGLMHVEVADSPEELEYIIRTEAEAGATARMVAGFCWPWTDPLGKGKAARLETDVRIGDWHRPWNAKGDSFRENGAVPPSTKWAVHPYGINQIGCVYSAQGLEWDWCGVIVGEDMVRRGDRWVYRKGRWYEDPERKVKRVKVPGSFDMKLREGTGSEEDKKEEFERCVRHAYHVLMTRASRATVLYSTDEETQAYLKSCVGEVQIHGLRPTWENLPAEARIPHPPSPKRKGNDTDPDQELLF